MRVKPHQFFHKNEVGRDYLVGDIHGRLTRLMSQLKAMNFDFKKDRLFAVGDLIDRYDESFECGKLLEEPWFFSVIGNHEELLLDATRKRATQADIKIHVKRGGWWAYEAVEGSSDVQPTAEAMQVRKLIKEHCSVLATIECSEGRVGLVHAMAPPVWPDDEEFQYDPDYIWGRSLFNAADRFGESWKAHIVEGIDAVVHGHNPSMDFVQNGNHLWIDTANFGPFCILTPAEAIAHAKRQVKAHKKHETTGVNPWMS